MKSVPHSTIFFYDAQSRATSVQLTTELLLDMANISDMLPSEIYKPIDTETIHEGNCRWRIYPDHKISILIDTDIDDVYNWKKATIGDLFEILTKAGPDATCHRVYH